MCCFDTQKSNFCPNMVVAQQKATKRNKRQQKTTKTTKNNKKQQKTQIEPASGGAPAGGSSMAQSHLAASHLVASTSNSRNAAACQQHT